MVEDDVAWRVVDGEAVLLHADSSAYYGLNASGTRLWARLADQPMTSEQLTAWAGGRFAEPPEGLSAEVSAFLEELSELSLLEADSVKTADEPALESKPAPEDEAPAWETPLVERFGELEKLILSGE